MFYAVLSGREFLQFALNTSPVPAGTPSDVNISMPVTLFQVNHSPLHRLCPIGHPAHTSLESTSKHPLNLFRTFVFIFVDITRRVYLTQIKLCCLPANPQPSHFSAARAVLCLPFTSSERSRSSLSSPRRIFPFSKLRSLLTTRTYAGSHRGVDMVQIQ